MLYRTPRLSLVTLLRRAAYRLAAGWAMFHRTGADAACLDALRDEQLRDLGIRRIESRDVRYYR